MKFLISIALIYEALVSASSRADSSNFYDGLKWPDQLKQFIPDKCAAMRDLSNKEICVIGNRNSHQIWSFHQIADPTILIAYSENLLKKNGVDISNISTIQVKENPNDDNKEIIVKIKADIKQGTSKIVCTIDGAVSKGATTILNGSGSCRTSEGDITVLKVNGFGTGDQVSHNVEDYHPHPLDKNTESVQLSGIRVN